MDRLKRSALLNAVYVIEGLEPGQSITREDLIEELRRPLPVGSGCPSDAEILHAYRHCVENVGVLRVYRTATYEEAATLTKKSVEAIRQAAYRQKLVKSTEYLNGKVRTGVYLKSLADWCGWTAEEYQEADSRLKSMRQALDDF